MVRKPAPPSKKKKKSVSAPGHARKNVEPVDEAEAAKLSIAVGQYMRSFDPAKSDASPAEFTPTTSMAKKRFFPGDFSVGGTKPQDGAVGESSPRAPRAAGSFRRQGNMLKGDNAGNFRECIKRTPSIMKKMNAASYAAKALDLLVTFSNNEISQITFDRGQNVIDHFQMLQKANEEKKEVLESALKDDEELEASSLELSKSNSSAISMLGQRKPAAAVVAKGPSSSPSPAQTPTSPSNSDS